MISTRAAVESNVSQIVLLPKSSTRTATNSQHLTPAVLTFPRAVQDILEAQIALSRQGISSGSVDGLFGSQTRAAVLAFQREQGLPETGELDEFTRELLIVDRPAFNSYVVTSNDLARLTPISPTWVGKSQQERLDYETLLELVAEKTRSHPNLIRKLNPAIDWNRVTPGTTLLLPDTDMRDMRKGAAFIRISLSTRTLQAFDASTNLIVHFPCSIAQRVEKRPAGELFITAIAPDPNYTFDPALFPESAEARELKRKLILPPGPNNPVGVAWISLSRPGYGIHGTPLPEHVGRTESHGCFRLANWNAAHLLRIVRTGLPVYVE
jgi:lipoprotein-anchoring transpeptidase ErfK/SrfK